MKRTSALFLSALFACSLQAQQTCLNETFDQGIPESFTIIDYDELPVNSGFKIPVGGNWFTQTVYGSKGKAAVSTSRHDFDLPASNWLITPQLTLCSANAILAWDAKSVHYDLRDGYKVMISTTDNQPESFVELCHVDAESYTWTHRLVSLSQYAGKKVYIAIHHDSQNKFLLAIDNLYVGEPQEIAFDAINRTPHFCGNTGTTKISGSLRNIGKITPLAKIICTSGLHVLTQELDGQDIETNTEVEYSFDLPVSLNTRHPYEIAVVTATGQTYTVVKDEICCSYYPRTLLVEKATGVWCTACPGVMGYLNELKEKYQNEVVLIESHSEFNDLAHLSFAPYDQGMSANNYPAIFFNRNHKYVAYDKATAEANLNQILNEETLALVKGKATLQDHKITVTTETLFGKELDNAKDRYRIGFAILQKHLQLPVSIQKSAVSGPDYQEFGFLSSPFAKDLMFFHNVVEGTDNAFTGIKESLPSQIEPNQTYQFESTLELPKEMTASEGFTVVAFVLDYFNNRVLNTCEFEISDVTGINKIASPTLEAYIKYDGQQYAIAFPQQGKYEISVYTVNGVCLLKKTGTENTVRFSTDTWNKGVYILRIEQNGKQLSKRINIK